MFTDIAVCAQSQKSMHLRCAMLFLVRAILSLAEASDAVHSAKVFSASLQGKWRHC